MSQRASRRDLMLGALSAGLGALWARPAAAGTPLLHATPVCAEEATPPQTAGPYFTPDSPPKQDFRADGPSVRPVELVGFVLDRSCRPIAASLIELWHADPEGRYDNRGYRYRGHGFTDGKGRFHFSTVMPGLYGGRTRHYHLKIQPPGGRVLTTQLYFPGEPRNERDFLFDARLLLDLAEAEAAQVGRYDFVVEAG